MSGFFCKVIYYKVFQMVCYRAFYKVVYRVLHMVLYKKESVIFISDGNFVG